MFRLFFGFLITPQGKFHLEKQPSWRLLQTSEERFIEAKYDKKVYFGRYFQQMALFEEINEEKIRIETLLGTFPDFPQKKIEFSLFYQTFIG